MAKKLAVIDFGSTYTAYIFRTFEKMGFEFEPFEVTQENPGLDRVALKRHAELMLKNGLMLNEKISKNWMFSWIGTGLMQRWIMDTKHQCCVPLANLLIKDISSAVTKQCRGVFLAKQS